MTETTQLSTNRIESIDALRGFALAGIVIVHMVEQYTASMIPEAWQATKNSGILDQLIDGTIFFLFRGKFFALFSLLFGLSYFIQMDRATQRGDRFEGRFLWRLIVLFLIGALHHMFYSGDILTIYATVGLLIIPLYHLKDRFILIIALLFLLGLGRFIIYSLIGIEEIIPVTGRGNEEYWAILETGSILNVFHINIIERMIAKVSYQLGFNGRGGLTFGFFLLGLWIGKTRILEKIETEKKKLKSAFVRSIAGTGLFLLATPALFMLNGQNEDLDNWIGMLALTSLDQFNLFLTFVIAVGFLLIFQKPFWNRIMMLFAPYGRMALTNYFFQSVIGTYILFGWGLGYVGKVTNTQMFLAALGIIIIQMMISKWWLTKFKYGPLEWFWRSATYLKWQEFKK